MTNWVRMPIALVLVLSAQSGYGQPPAPGEEKGAPALVGPRWLQPRLEDPEIRIVELGQTREAFFAAHIPAAVFVDWRTEIADSKNPERYNKISKEKMELLLGSRGISETTTIVISDNLDNRLSARLFWLLRYYGHPKIHILDGGRNAWRRANYDFVSDKTAIKKTQYRAGRVNPSYSTSMEFIHARLAAPEVVLVDGRPNKQFSGEEPGKVFHTGTEHAKRGHIPGARNIPWKANLDADGTFKSVEDLRELYAGLGITKEKTVIAYCNEGLHAASPWFVMAELLGYPDVRLYDDSMSEWANSLDAPVVVGNKP